VSNPNESHRREENDRPQRRIQVAEHKNRSKAAEASKRLHSIVTVYTIGRRETIAIRCKKNKTNFRRDLFALKCQLPARIQVSLTFDFSTAAPDLVRLTFIELWPLVIRFQ
jgi:hypothetical protein